MTKWIICIISTIVLTTNLSAQEEVLFSIDNKQIYVSEFDYIYRKNNGDKANYSKESIEEYLDLYIKFKLKVTEARALKIDTITQLKNELLGYRKQLANSFLLNKEIIDKIVDDVYKAKQYDYRVSHILASVTNFENKQQVENARQKINVAYERIKSDNSRIDQIATEISDDPNSKINKGQIGWLTAPLPDGFIAFENQMISLDVGEVSEPFKTTLGFHIIKLEEKRAARGEIEVAHIVIHKVKNGRLNNEAKLIADSVYMQAVQGASFVQLAKQYSDDKKTAETGGYLGFFGINEFDVIFEDAAFALVSDGELSKPIETSLGFHIIKRISKKNLHDKTAIKSELKKNLKNSNRVAKAKLAKVKEIQSRSDFSENIQVKNDFLQSINDTFKGPNWNILDYSEEIMFAYGNEIVYTQRDVAKTIEHETLKRQRLTNSLGPQRAANQMLNDLIIEKAFEYEEAHLEDNYPEFASLMKEYEEGILLFEVTKDFVWDKASTDTIGLKSFFNRNQNNYLWGQRARIGIYNINSTDPEFISKINNFISNGKEEIVIKTVDSQGNNVINYTEKTIQISSPLLANNKVELHSVFIIPDDDKTQIIKILEIIPSSIKTLDEAKGYVIADYQEELEKEWVEKLASKYHVKINKSAKKGLVKNN